MTNYLIDGDLGQESLFQNMTGLSYYLNFLYTNDPLDSYFVDYLNLNSTRARIGVGNVTFSNGPLVEYHMRTDICQSVRNRVENVLDSGYSVMFYNGQLDVVVGPIFTQTMISKMKWKGRRQFDKATRQIWKVKQNDTEVAGYVKRGGGFWFAVIRDAGHLAPHDQARASFDLISNFIDHIVSGTD